MALKSVLLLVLLLSLAPGQLPPSTSAGHPLSSLVTRHPSLAAAGWSGSRFPGRAREASQRRATSLGVLGSGVPGTSQSRCPVKRDDFDDPFCPPLPFQPVHSPVSSMAYHSCEAPAVSVVFDGWGSWLLGRAQPLATGAFHFTLLLLLSYATNTPQL
ncbi:hypothetical protein CKAH01_04998 [Colletotrichum kahawae]|uniref:Uncharacterized protein n=1 Tax=Colletotrichum kahawae TaxID=34407 RepID=A0AAD9YEZ5_COLKA|nr:hypothetical protein CKAH01_04998 [Colletotrichum kahawae]